MNRTCSRANEQEQRDGNRGDVAASRIDHFGLFDRTRKVPACGAADAWRTGVVHHGRSAARWVRSSWRDDLMWRARRSPSTFGFLASTYFLERDSINMRGNIANTCHITGPFQAPSPKQI